MRRVLIVDDDRALAWIARASLARFGGHEVETAASVAQARAKLSEAEYDVVLLDAMMPSETGLTLLDWMKAEPRLAGVPVVMLTAQTTESDRAHFASLGARGVIAKPFDPRTLASSLDALLEVNA